MTPDSPALRRLVLASAAGLPLASTAGLPLDAAAQTATTPTQQPVAQANPDAIRVLLEQSAFWRANARPDKADEALARVLALDPTNADALALQAQSAADQGNQQTARSAVAKLKAARPDDARIAGIEQSVRSGPIDQAAVSEARGLAQAGKSAEAVAAYRRAFRGDTPPASLATEYYQALAAVDGNQEAAQTGLAAHLRSDPDDLRAQLAYAQSLTYRESTRSAGIDRLRVLASMPAIAPQARSAWRDALIWSGANPQTLDQVDAYLKVYPNDPQMVDRRSQLAAALPDTSARDRMTGYQALEQHKRADAEHAFMNALAANPNDVDSLAMLSIIRRQQGRVAEARSLIEKAVALAPDRRDELLNATGANAAATNARYTGDGGAAVRRRYAWVATLTNRGQYRAAEAALRKLMGRHPTSGNLVQLGYIQLRAGKVAEAEASFRRVLATRPRDPAANGGMAAVLARQGDTAGAIALYAKIGNKAGLRSLEQTRASALRDQAHNATDTAEKLRLYREAVAAEPANPWLRLEFARVLLAENQGVQARQVMDPVITSRVLSIDQARAVIYYAESSHDDALANSLVLRLPPRARTAEIEGIQTRAQIALDLKDARSQPTQEAVRDRMIALAAKPDPTGGRGAAFATELIKDGDKPGAREVIRVALNSSHPPLAQQRITYASMLVAAGYPKDAQSVTAGLQPGALNPLERTTLTTVQNSAAIESADMLNNRGQSAEAYDELAPRLAQEPANPDLNLALARLYQTKQKPQTALEIDEALLKSNPDDLNVRTATISAAVQAGEVGRAAALARDTKEKFPDEPQAWMASAQVARARHNSGEALIDLRTARELRTKQLAAMGSADATESLGNRLRRVQYALYIPFDTASDVYAGEPAPAPGAMPGEPVTREYERYAQYVPPAGASLSTNSASPNRAPPATDIFRPANVNVPPGTVPLISVTDGPSVDPTKNPFRNPPADGPDGVPSIITLQHTSVQASAPADPVMADIDRSMEQIAPEVAPAIEGSLVMRGRSGTSGFGKLFDLSSPVVASYSPDGYGRLKVAVTPTLLLAGKANSGDLPSFGTNFLHLNALRTPRTTAFGAGLDVSYAYDIVTADVGASPLGFTVPNVIGGVEIAPELADNLTLHVLAERRSVTDSLLSYAGDKDPQTGKAYGGVTRNRGHLQLDATVDNVNYYVGGGAGMLLGQNVKSNAEIDAGAGFNLPIWSTPTQEVRAGLDLVYYSYNKNLQNFSYGSGGYFSPQSYFAALIPVTYRENFTPDLTYRVSGAIGLQTFTEKSEPVFFDGALESQLRAIPGANTQFSGAHHTGPAGGASAEIDYRVIDNLHIGARAGFDRAGNFTEGTGLLYARYVFNEPQ